MSGIRRVPIRSPIQRADITSTPKPAAPKTPDLSAFAEIGKLIEELTKLRDEMQRTYESGVWKGEKGDQGEKGESVLSPDDFMPYVEYILHMVKSDMPIPKNGTNGKDGITPVRGIDYHTESDKQDIIEHVTSRIPKPKDGVSPAIDHEQLASTVIARILDGKMLKKEHVEGLTQEIASYRAQFANGKGYVHGGGDTVVAGSGVTIIPNSNGTKTISAPGSGGLNYLAATGIVNNTNATFTFASPPIIVVTNGASYVNGFGVTITGTTAVLDNPPGKGGSVYGLG